MERPRECYVLNFPPSVSRLVLGSRVEKGGYFFILCAHIQYTYIFISQVQNQKVEFPMKYLFFNNQLVFQCDRNYNVQLLQGFEEGVGGRSYSEGCVLLFLQGFIFDCCFLVGHLC